MADEVEVLHYGFSLDPKAAIQAAAKMQSEISKRLKLIEKAEDRVSQGVGRYILKVGSTRKVLADVAKRQETLRKGISKAWQESYDKTKQYAAEVNKLDKTLETLQERSKSSSGDELKNIQTTIGKLKETKKLRGQELKNVRDIAGQQQQAMKELTAGGAGIRQKMTVEPELLPNALREAGEELSKPLEIFMRKDFPGAIEAGFGLAGKSIQGILGGAFGRFKGLGAKDTTKMGGPMKAVAGLSKMLAGPLKAISKMGPMLGLMGGLVFGLIKLFLDAEAAAKDYNKQILETTSTSGYMASSLGDVGKATKQLRNDLKAAQEGAIAWENVQWGISKEVAASFQQALGAEGVSLQRLGTDLDTASGYAQSHARAIQMSVAYSRSFGVSLNELTQLQGEFMSELGMGLDSVQESFQIIAKGAAEAGMASNKFFGIIRSFSADLTLFTLRLQDVAKTLKLAGQAMSPREAQQFLQTLNQQFSGGVQDNLRRTVIAGTKGTRAGTRADVEGRLEGLLADVAGRSEGAADELRRILSDPNRDPRAVAKWQAKMTADLQSQGKSTEGVGSLVSSVQDAVTTLTRLEKGGAINTAATLNALSPLGKYEQIQRESMKLIGKPIEEASGQQLLVLESVGTASLEQINQMIKFRTGMFAKQEQLLQQIESGNVTDKEGVDKLQKALGVQGDTGKDAADHMRALLETEDGRRKFYNTLTDDQKKLLEGSNAEIEAQKQMSEFRTSVTDKLGIIVDTLLNRIFSILQDIYDLIDGIPFVGKKREVKTWAGQKKGTPMTQAERATWTRTKELVMGMNRGQKAAYDSGVKKAGGRGKMTLEQQFDLAVKHSGKKGAAAKAALAGDLKAAPSAEPQKVEVKPTAATKPQPVKIEESNDSKQAETADETKKMRRQLKKGVALDRPTSAYKTAATSSTLEAIRKGLFEYYMYSGLDRRSVATAMGQGWSPEQIAQGVVGEAVEKGAAGMPEATIGRMMTARPNAEGGMVASIVNGKANVERLPAGEGWAPLGRGEGIVPAGRGGGGGQVIELRMKGDLGRYIEAKVIDGTANFQRNRRLR